MPSRTRHLRQRAYLIHMLRMRKKPPAGLTNINCGKPWSKMDLADLKQCLALGDSAKAIADFLCREPGEVRAKIEELYAHPPSRASE